jgi:hypothetical protein
LLVNARRHPRPSEKQKSAFLLVLIASTLHGTSLDNETSSRATHASRIRSRYVLRESHEGCHHKRVHIVGSDRNRSACACVGSFSGSKRDSRSGKRTATDGTNSVWRCRERSQWFWPPHGQDRLPITQKPRRATVKRGPHILSLTWPRELSSNAEEVNEVIKSNHQTKGAKK